MQDTTPKLITVDQFNDKVRGWSVSRRSGMSGRAPQSGVSKKAGDEPELKSSIKTSVYKVYGVSAAVRFTFERHGIYVHYGAGRGYGGTNGSGWIVKDGKRKKTAESSRNKMNTGNRHGTDWFNVEIRTGIAELADIAQEYYADMSLDYMLEKMGRAQIG